MREFAFTVEFAKNSDAVTDVFIQYPDLLGNVLSISSSKSGTWQTFLVSGPQEGLESLDDVYLSHSNCNECLGEHTACDANWEYEIITETDGTRTYYSAIDTGNVSYCHSIPYLANEYLGNGVLFDARRRENRYEWRLLVRDDHTIGLLFDALQTELPTGVTVTLEQIVSPERWGSDASIVSDLPTAQRQTLLCAFDMGYYETPRSVTTSDVADQLGLPTSTCRYRLRRAESALVSVCEKIVPRRSSE
ncbi:helix-turn-helix domain-containing protein [Haladaptatus sp. DFWS20]|uniref:helix-turn-helix domain-containing protein n=1 Tax=Haladaptatus sp. DFWS20 TaxID=3403467 RepID=UPI003EBAFFF6